MRIWSGPKLLPGSCPCTAHSSQLSDFTFFGDSHCVHYFFRFMVLKRAEQEFVFFACIHLIFRNFVAGQYYVPLFLYCVINSPEEYPCSCQQRLMSLEFEFTRWFPVSCQFPALLTWFYPLHCRALLFISVWYLSLISIFVACLSVWLFFGFPLCFDDWCRNRLGQLPV